MGECDKDPQISSATCHWWTEIDIRRTIYFANTNRILLKLSIYHSFIIWSRRPESFDSRSFPNERCVDHNTEEWFVRDQSELPRPISINSANVPAFLPALEQKIFTAIAAEKQMTQVDRHYKGKRLDNNTKRKPSPLYNGAWIEWCSFTLWQTIFSIGQKPSAVLSSDQ